MEKCPVCKSEDIFKGVVTMFNSVDFISISFCSNCGVSFMSEKSLKELRKKRKEKK